MSGAMSRRKGSAAERAVVNYLRSNGWPHAERKGTGFPGADVAELGPGLELEVKNHARIELAAWVDQLTDAMAATDADMGAVIVKRAGTTNVADWWFVQPVRLSVEAADLAAGRQGKTWISWCKRFLADQLPVKYDELEQTALGYVPVLRYQRPGRDIADHYDITTVAHGVRLLRLAGWGDPIEPKETRP